MCSSDRESCHTPEGTAYRAVHEWFPRSLTRLGADEQCIVQSANLVSANGLDSRVANGPHS